MEEKKILVAKYGSDKTPLCLGNLEIPCYVLDNGMRVFSGRGIQKAIGYDSKSGQWMNSFCKMDGVSSYLCAGDNSISERLSKPIKFKRNNAGGSQSTANGYEVTLLVDICSAIIDANRAGVFDNNVIVRNADIIIRSVAKVGIIALVDEATGYQYERENDELQKILKAYISEELLPWQKRCFSTFAKSAIDNSDKKQSTKDNLHSTLAVLNDFRSGLDFKDITYTFLRDFEQYLREKGNADNTIAKHMKQLRILVNEAINQGYMHADAYPFRN